MEKYVYNSVSINVISQKLENHLIDRKFYSLIQQTLLTSPNLGYPGKRKFSLLNTSVFVGLILNTNENSVYGNASSVINRKQCYYLRYNSRKIL